MNCNLAAGILDTQAVSPAAARVVPAGQTRSEHSSFSAILGDQHPAESVADAPAAAKKLQSASADAKPLPGRTQRVPESSLPISRYPETGSRLDSSRPYKDETIQIKSGSSQAAAVETRASLAFRQEQTGKSTKAGREQEQPEPDTEDSDATLLMQAAIVPAVPVPVDPPAPELDSDRGLQLPEPGAPIQQSPAVAAEGTNPEGQTLEEISAPQTVDPASAPQFTDASQAARTDSQSAASQLAQVALTGRNLATPAGAAGTRTTEVTNPETPQGPMHTALKGMLTWRSAGESAPQAATEAVPAPDKAISLLKTADSEAMNRRAFEPAGPQPGYQSQPAAIPEAQAQAVTAPAESINPVTALKSAESAPADRHTEERTKETVPQKSFQSMVSSSEGTRTQNLEPTVKPEAFRPAPGVEMTRRIEAVQTAQSAVRGSVHSITIPIGQESNPVATLRLVQQSSGVQITVQTPDAALSQTMQANLPQLLRGLEDSGFKADFQTQPTAHLETASAPVRTALTDNRQASSFDQGSTQQDGPAHGQGREKRQPSHQWREWLQHGRKQNKEGN
jgi:hypothetical protein